MLHDRTCGSQRIRADAEHHGVARANHAARVGEHVGTPFEHETDDPERCAIRLHRPLRMIHAGDQPVAPAGRVTPATQPCDHVRPHAGVEHQPRRRASPARRRRDVSGVRVGDRREHVVVAQRLREPGEEVRDGIVVARRERREAIDRFAHGGADQFVHRGRNVEQGPGRLHDDQAIAGTEGVGEFGVDTNGPIATERDELTGRQVREWCDLRVDRHRH